MARMNDESFGNLSRILAAEALLRLEETRQETLEVRAKLAAYENDQGDTALELRNALEIEREASRDALTKVGELAEQNRDLLKRLQLLSPKGVK